MADQVNNAAPAVIGIGASAGGVEAIQSFFKAMPTDSGMAFVVLLHLPVGHRSMLPELLGRWTAMPVREGTGGVAIEPNCVYVPPPGAIVTLVDGRFSVHLPAPEERRVTRPIDAFFDALAAAFMERAVGIVLSGTGSDGALGLKAIKELGGFTMAQGTDGSAPQYGGMPAGAIATGSVDLVVAVEDMAAHLIRLRERASAPPAPLPDDDANQEAFRLGIATLCVRAWAMTSAATATRLSSAVCSGACRWRVPPRWTTTSPGCSETKRK